MGVTSASMRDLFSSPLARIAVFVWGFIFPFVFVAWPLLKVATGDGEFEMSVVWAFLVWVLSPLALSIGLKYWGGKKGLEE